MTTGYDPVVAGLVTSLAHPGGNITGLSAVASEDTLGKRLELLKMALPRAQHIAVLGDPSMPAYSAHSRDIMQQAAQTLHIELIFFEARTADEIADAFSAMSREHIDAVDVLGNPIFYLQISRITDLAAVNSLPAIYFSRGFVAAGGLMSYGTDLTESDRRAASYVDKILRGANPADLPIEQPTKFELVVNLKTAKLRQR